MFLYLLCIVMVMAISLPANALEDSLFSPCFCPGHLNGTEAYTPGEINHDGQINASDALHLMRWQVKKISFYEDGRLCSSIYVMDVNADSHIDAKDALDILKYSVKKIDGFARQPVLYTHVTNTDVTVTDCSK